MVVALEVVALVVVTVVSLEVVAFVVVAFAVVAFVVVNLTVVAVVVVPEATVVFPEAVVVTGGCVVVSTVVLFTLTATLTVMVTSPRGQHVVSSQTRFSGDAVYVASVQTPGSEEHPIVQFLAPQARIFEHAPLASHEQSSHEATLTANRSA